MVDREAGGGIDVADGAGGGFDGGHEFHCDFAALGVVVCFPAVFEFVGADGADVFVEDPFVLAADFVGVFGTGGADDRAGFFYFPA